MSVGIGRKKHKVSLGEKGSFEIKHPGGLHDALGSPRDESIPASELESKSGDSSHLKHMKASAKGLKAMK